MVTSAIFTALLATATLAVASLTERQDDGKTEVPAKMDIFRIDMAKLPESCKADCTASVALNKDDKCQLDRKCMCTDKNGSDVAKCFSCVVVESEGDQQAKLRKNLTDSLTGYTSKCKEASIKVADFKLSDEANGEGNGGLALVIPSVAAFSATLAMSALFL